MNSEVNAPMMLAVCLKEELTEIGDDCEYF